jgi:hypothetical protein
MLLVQKSKGQRDDVKSARSKSRKGNNDDCLGPALSLVNNEVISSRRVGGVIPLIFRRGSYFRAFPLASMSLWGSGSVVDWMLGLCLIW